ncbi:MAG: biotin/lipoyl-containing protein [Ostreibacterium sp.]
MEHVTLQTSGNIWKVLVKVGDKVESGQVLFIMEVMKMEVMHEADCNGVIKEIHIKEGDEGLDADMIAISIEPS